MVELLSPVIRQNAASVLRITLAVVSFAVLLGMRYFLHGASTQLYHWTIMENHISIIPDFQVYSCVTIDHDCEQILHLFRLEYFLTLRRTGGMYSSCCIRATFVSTTVTVAFLPLTLLWTGGTHLMHV